MTPSKKSGDSEETPVEHPFADPYTRATGEAPAEDVAGADEAPEASEDETEGVAPTA